MRRRAVVRMVTDAVHLPSRDVTATEPVLEFGMNFLTLK
jgi:hypothetical protein